jgi:hypothetical protein
VDLADAGDEILAVFFTEDGEVGLEAGFERSKRGANLVAGEYGGRAHNKHVL